MSSGEAQGEASKMAGQAQGEASKMAGQAQGKAQEVVSIRYDHGRQNTC